MQIKTKSYVQRYAGDAVDLGTWQPPTRRRVRDGEILIEKLPSAAHLLMLKPSGGAHNIQLANGMGRPRANDPYKVQMLSEKMEKGFLPYGSCPKYHGQHRFLPKDIPGAAPCERDATGTHPVSDEHPCNCIVETRKVRLGIARKVNDEQERRQQSKDQRELKATEDQNQLLTKALGALADKQEYGIRATDDGGNRGVGTQKDAWLEIRLEPLYEIGAVDGASWEEFQSLTAAAFGSDGRLYLLDSDGQRVVAADQRRRQMRATARQPRSLPSKSKARARYVVTAAMPYSISAIDRPPRESAIKPLTEETIPHPNTDYGKSKLLAEETLIQSGLPYTILRPSYIYGPHPRVGSSMDRLIRDVRDQRSYTRIPFPGRASEIHAGDLARLIWLCTGHAGAENEVFFAANPEPVVIGDVFPAVAEALGVPYKARPVDAAAVEDPLCRLGGRAERIGRLGSDGACHLNEHCLSAARGFDASAGAGCRVKCRQRRGDPRATESVRVGETTGDRLHPSPCVRRRVRCRSIRCGGLARRSCCGGPARDFGARALGRRGQDAIACGGASRRDRSL